MCSRRNHERAFRRRASGEFKDGGDGGEDDVAVIAAADRFRGPWCSNTMFPYHNKPLLESVNDYKGRLPISNEDDIAEKVLGPMASSVTAAEILEIAERLLSPERMAKIAAVAAQRTFSVVPVIEGVHNTGNISAVARSAEALG